MRTRYEKSDAITIYNSYLRRHTVRTYKSPKIDIMNLSVGGDSRVGVSECRPFAVSFSSIVRQPRRIAKRQCCNKQSESIIVKRRKMTIVLINSFYCDTISKLC